MTHVLNTPLFCAGLMITWVLALPAQGATESEKRSDLWKEASLVTTYTLSTQLSPFDIDTEVMNETAIIRGTVESEVERDLAEELALSIDGISRVDNQLTVDPDSRPTPNADSQAALDWGQRVQDAAATARIKSQLLWNNSTSGLEIDVDTRGAEVMLTGQVASEAESELAAQIARNTNGVRRVTNQLRVTGETPSLEETAARKTRQAGQVIDDGWITTKVKSALLYNRLVEGTAIDVNTEDGVVTLRGALDSEPEREEALSVARGVKGVKEVQLEPKEAQQ